MYPILKVCLLIIIYVSTSTVLLSNNKLDSLIQVTKTLEDSRKKVKNLIKISEKTLKTDSLTSHQSVLEAISISQKLKNDTILVDSRIQLFQFMRDNYGSRGYQSCLDSLQVLRIELDEKDYYKQKNKINILIGSMYVQLKNFDKALEVTEEIYNTYVERGDTTGQHFMVNLFYNAHAYMRLHKLPQAISRYKELERKAESAGRNDLLFPAYSNLDGLFSKIKDYERSIEYGRRALNLVPPQNSGRLKILFNLGNRFFNVNQLDSSEYYLLQVRDHPKTKPSLLISTNSLLAEISLLKGENDMAEQYLRKANKLKAGSETTIDGVNLLYVEAVLEHEKGNTTLAKKLLIQSINEIEKRNSESNHSNKQQRYDKYLTWTLNGQSKRIYKAYAEVVDSMMNESIINNTIKHEIAFEAIEKKQEIEFLKKENEFKALKIGSIKSTNNLLALLSLSLISALYFFFKSNKSRKENLEIVEGQNVNLQSLNQSLKTELKNAQSVVGNWDNIKDQMIELPGKEKRKLRIGEILYIKSDGNGLYIFTNSDKHHVWLRLKHIFDLLPESVFKQCHKSYIVNIKEIEKLNTKYLMIKGTKVPLGGKYKDKLHSVL